MYVAQPVGQILERLLGREVKHDNDAVGSLVVRVRHGSVSLLAGRVPYLQLNGGVVDLKSAESLQGLNDSHLRSPLQSCTGNSPRSSRPITASIPGG